MQIEILLAIQTLLLGLVSYLLRTMYDDYKEYRRNVEKRLNDIENNYLSRFEKIHDKINLSEKEIIKVITQLKYEHGTKSEGN